MKKILALLLIQLGMSVAWADNQAATDFYTRKSEWWFWYREPPVPSEPEEPEKPEEPVAPPPVMAQQQESSQEPEKKGPPVLSTAWLATNLETFRQQAMDNPTEENVALYWWLERVAKDKADLFTQVSRKVFYKDPLLNEDSRRPWSDEGQRHFDQQRSQATESLLRSLAGKIGIYFFYESSCPYCAAIAPVLKSLEMRYGFKVLPISLDGLPLPSSYYESNYVVDSGQAAMLGVQKTPTLFIVRPPNEFARLVEGFMPMKEMTEVMLLLANEQGWITQEQYAATRPYNNLLVDPSLALPPDAELKPSELINLIRSNVKRY